jgi:uncharacterized lipoprotein
MVLIKYFSFASVFLWLVACSDVKTIVYKDTSDLETPPEMEIVEKPKEQVEENQEIEDMGLGDLVSLAGTEDKPVIKIKKMFDRSWELVEQAIKLNEIEVTDKNREKGVFYVLFDPDDQSSESPKSTTFSFFGGEYDEGTYQITVVWRESDTEVTAELVIDTHSDLLDDEEDKEDFEGTVAGGDHLLKTLYKTLRHDLPMK